jgi:glycosyltransferase involved in cell wall biosynthesis
MVRYDFMRAVISVDRPFHASLLANSIARLGSSVEIYTSAPRRFYKGLSSSVQTHLAASPLQIAAYGLKGSVPRRLARLDTCFFDLSVSALMGRSDVFIGWATQALFSAKRAKKRGGVFVLDRACPHRDFQESLVERESERLGVKYVRQPDWFRDRQLEEYELAKAILVPSEYTARTFPEPLQCKLIKAPLLGRCAEPDGPVRPRDTAFTVGVLGGSPVRKGYLYLLKAWRKLALPNAKLLLRSGNLLGYPVLRDLIRAIPNVEFVDYVPNISEFYRRCDVFVLPSVDDGFGMALIEAMLNGCACITTSNTGASELTTSGRDSITVEPANEEQLAAALLRLYEDKELRAAMGENAATRARQIAASGLYDRAISSLLTGIEAARPDLSAHDSDALHSAQRPIHK